MFKGMMKALKISCEDISPLISESRDHCLPLCSRLRLKMHLSICGLCEIYQEQLEIICKAAKSLGSDESKALAQTDMNPQVKEKIQKWIKEKMDYNGEHR
jgi:hypothetical protein